MTKSDLSASADPAEAALAEEFGAYLGMLASDFGRPLVKQLGDSEAAFAVRAEAATQALLAAGKRAESAVSQSAGHLSSVAERMAGHVGVHEQKIVKLTESAASALVAAGAEAEKRAVTAARALDESTERLEEVVRSQQQAIEDLCASLDRTRTQLLSLGAIGLALGLAALLTALLAR